MNKDLFGAFLMTIPIMFAALTQNDFLFKIATSVVILDLVFAVYGKHGKKKE
jgi:hypothetical protein